MKVILAIYRFFLTWQAVPPASEQKSCSFWYVSGIYGYVRLAFGLYNRRFVSKI